MAPSTFVVIASAVKARGPFALIEEKTAESKQETAQPFDTM